EQLHDLDRVVVAVPDRDLTPCELGRDLLRRPAGQAEGKGRHPALPRPQPVETARLRHTVEEALPQHRLVSDDRIPPERLDVLDGRDEAGEQLVLLRPVLKAIPDRLVARPSHPVTAPATR